MQCQKITLPPSEHDNLLTKLWRRITVTESALINGSNFFTGDAVLSDENSIVHSNFQGEISYTAHNEEGWERIWDTIGRAPPGKLPRKATAQLHLHVLQGKHTSFSIENTTSNENGTEIPTLTWLFDKVVTGDQRHHAAFAILLKPKALDNVHTHYKDVAENHLFR